MRYLRSKVVRRVILLGLIWAWRRQREMSHRVPVTHQVVIVTGASSGIGRATAHAFASAGARVVLVARREDILQTVADELRAYGVQSLVITADITRETDRQRVLDETLATFSRVDVLVNCAGLTIAGAFSDQDPDTIYAMVDLNLTASMRLSQMILPHFKAQHSGVIINVGSIAGRIASPGYASYVATKFGLRAFSTALRREVANDGIHVGYVMPGFTDTPMLDHIDRNALTRQGGIPPFIVIHDPDTVGQAIVNCTVFRRREVVMGGLVFVMGAEIEQHAPRLLDQIIRWFGVERLLSVMRGL